MSSALSCAYSLRAVAPRRGNCRGFGPGPFNSASRAAAIRASLPLPGVGSKEDPALLFNFSRLTSNNACQPKLVNGGSVPMRNTSDLQPNWSIGGCDDASLAGG